MQEAAAAYTDCVAREAEKHVKNPAGAEDIAVAAHGRCWSAWEAYRDASRINFFHAVRTAEEKQLAGDRLEAHLRGFELETRRAVVDDVIQRGFPGGR